MPKYAFLALISLTKFDGVSSAIQTQIDAKIATTASASNDFVTFTRLNANLDIVQDNVASVSAGAVSLSNILHTTSTANSYATGGTTSNLDKVLVFLNGVQARIKSAFLIFETKSNFSKPILKSLPSSLELS